MSYYYIFIDSINMSYKMLPPPCIDSINMSY